MVTCEGAGLSCHSWCEHGAPSLWKNCCATLPKVLRSARDQSHDLLEMVRNSPRVGTKPPVEDDELLPKGLGSLCSR